MATVDLSGSRAPTSQDQVNASERLQACETRD
jgi:hypothetical protein